jgi:hypothetical protein
LLLAVCAIILAFSLTACNKEPVAAVVNGTEILEQQVTDRIMSLRNSSPEYADDASWATALASAQLTPTDLREQVIDTFIDNELIIQEAAKREIIADEASIDEQITSIKESVGVTDDAAWVEILVQYGYIDEADLRENLVTQDLSTQINDALTNEGGTDVQSYLEQLREEAGDKIKINDMPKDLPYDVDMSLASEVDAQGAEESTDASASTTTTASESAAVQDALAKGLVIEDTVVGEGAEALPGSTVQVNYTGTLEDGTVFDSKHREI